MKLVVGLPNGDHNNGLLPDRSGLSKMPKGCLMLACILVQIPS